MGEEGRLPGCGPREPEHRLSSLRPQDRPARKEGGPQRRQGPDRTLSEVTLKLSDQVVQQTEKPQDRLGRREQNPSAPKACLSSLIRFSLSARPL